MERCVKLFCWQAYSPKTGFYATNKFLFAFFLSFYFLNKASFFLTMLLKLAVSIRGEQKASKLSSSGTEKKEFLKSCCCMYVVQFLFGFNISHPDLLLT